LICEERFEGSQNIEIVLKYIEVRFELDVLLDLTPSVQDAHSFEVQTVSHFFVFGFHLLDTLSLLEEVLSVNFPESLIKDLLEVNIAI
jgi:hypothetical protein